MVEARPTSSPEVLVYGGELAALETALALIADAGDRLRVTILSPARDLSVRTGAIGTRSGERASARFDLGALAAELGLGFLSGLIAAVDDERGEVRTIAAETITYDRLVITSGARPRASLPGAATCWGPTDSTLLERMLGTLHGGGAVKVVFAVPESCRWTLPTYELALAAAEKARAEGLTTTRMSLATYEDAPLELLGEPAVSAISEELAAAGIDLLTGVNPVSFDGENLRLAPEGTVAADLVIAVAVQSGGRIRGLPADENGFLPVDSHGRVEGCNHVWAAGEATGFPVREPGIAAQQAHVVAASIASELGAPVVAERFRPVLNGTLQPRNGAAPTGNGSGRPPHLLWWPPDQLAGRHLPNHLTPKLSLQPPSREGSIAFAVELSSDGRPLADQPL